MLAIFLIFFDVEDGQHINSTFAWLCRENQIFEKTVPKLGQHLNPAACMHIYAVVLLSGPSLAF